MRIFIVFIFSLCYSVDFVSSQDVSATVLSIEDKEIPVNDYINFVILNDPDRTKTIKENSGEFIDYQLKLFDAKQDGYDTSQVISWRKII